MMKRVILSPSFLSIMEAQGSDGDKTVVFPFYWDINSPKESTFSLFPVYYQNREGDAAFHLLLNTYWGRSPEGGYRGFFPLYFQWEDRDEASKIIGPVYWSQNHDSTGSRFALFPLIWHRSDKSKASFDFFPFMHYEREKHSETAEFSILWRLYHRKRTSDTLKTVGLYGLYLTENRDKYTSSRFIPFYNYEHDMNNDKDETYFSLLLELFKYRRVNNKKEIRILFIPVYRNF